MFPAILRGADEHQWSCNRQKQPGFSPPPAGVDPAPGLTCSAVRQGWPVPPGAHSALLADAAGIVLNTTHLRTLIQYVQQVQGSHQASGRPGGMLAYAGLIAGTINAGQDLGRHGYLFSSRPSGIRWHPVYRERTNLSTMVALASLKPRIITSAPSRLIQNRSHTLQQLSSESQLRAQLHHPVRRQLEIGGSGAGIAEHG